MYNSTIKRKPCKCGCGKPPKIGLNGFASVKCMPEEQQNLLQFKKGAVAAKKQAKINDLSKKVREYQRATGEPEWAKNAANLAQWFKTVANEIEKHPYCWNCGEWISPKYYRHASAHIFPKAHFFSVSTNPHNFLVLGAGCGCHSEFDSSVEKACKMPVWGKAVERFKLFEHEIKERHKYLDLFKKQQPLKNA